MSFCKTSWIVRDCRDMRGCTLMYLGWRLKHSSGPSVEGLEHFYLRVDLVLTTHLEKGTNSRLRLSAQCS